MTYAKGCIADKPDERDLKFSFFHTKQTSLPSRCNILEPFLPPILDQGKIGLCTAASTTRALKARMSYLKYAYPYMPSALFLYALVRQFEGTPLTEDSGAAVRDIMKVASANGICPEDSNSDWSWPFSVSDDRWQQQPPPACVASASHHKLVKYMRLSEDPDEAKTALVQGMPIVIGMRLRESFEGKRATNTGIIPMPRPSEEFIGGHALYLFGFGNYTNGYVDGCNSWSTSWGDNGKFHLPWRVYSDPEHVSDRWALDLNT